MKDVAEKSRAVCVLGMHRSGTSVIARAVNLLGAYLGEEGDMMPPTEDNPRGYWERVDIMFLNDRLLAQLNRPWDTALPLVDGWQRSGAVEELREEMTSLVKNNFSGRGLWAWKDPRTSVLFDLWRDVVTGLGMELVCVFVVRNPLDVARSQLKRDGLPLDKSFGIWFNYNITALRAVRGLPCSFLSYDAFLADWEGVLRRCADELAIPWPEDDRALKEEMAGFISPGLRHSQSEIDELRQAGAPPQVVELAEILEDLTAGTTPFDDALGARVEEMYQSFSSYSAFYRHDMEQLFSKDKILAEKERLLAVKERRLEDVLNSWSWKVTAPLRKGLNLLTGK